MVVSKFFWMAGAVGGVTAAMALQGTVQGKLKVPAAPAPKGFALEIGGQMAGWLRNFQPGATTNPNGAAPSISPQPFNLQLGISESGPLLDWIQGVLSGQEARKNGAIVACNFNYEATGRLDFFNALIEEVQFPSMDAQLNMAGFVNLRVRADRTFPRKVRGPRYAAPAENKAKAWHVSNFRVSIGNLPCTRISKIDALTFKRGGPMGINYHLNSGDAPAWQAMVNQPGAPVPGKIEFLATDKSTVLATLAFKLNRVRGVQPSNYGPGPDGQPRSTAFTAIFDPVFTIQP